MAWIDWRAAQPAGGGRGGRYAEWTSADRTCRGPVRLERSADRYRRIALQSGRRPYRCSLWLPRRPGRWRVLQCKARGCITTIAAACQFWPSLVYETGRSPLLETEMRCTMKVTHASTTNVVSGHTTWLWKGLRLIGAIVGWTFLMLSTLLTGFLSGWVMLAAVHVKSLPQDMVLYAWLVLLGLTIGLSWLVARFFSSWRSVGW